MFDTLPGLFIGIAVSLLLLLYCASRPNVAVLGRVPGASRHWGDIARHPENEQVPGVSVLRVEGGLFFANAEHVREEIQGHTADGKIDTIVLDARTMPFVDVTAAGMLNRLRDELGGQGVHLLLARDVGQVRDVLRQSKAADDTESLPTYPGVEEAVSAASALRAEGLQQP